mmetsp:Transcript_11780/g.28889  ORF Transcript_11780/g.28889 Transcript_11780/m.28889 type:complete len:217 (+) Transcript_11780:408-1058(+)
MQQQPPWDMSGKRGHCLSCWPAESARLLGHPMQAQPDLCLNNHLVLGCCPQPPETEACPGGAASGPPHGAAGALHQAWYDQNPQLLPQPGPGPSAADAVWVPTDTAVHAPTAWWCRSGAAAATTVPAAQHSGALHQLPAPRPPRPTPPVPSALPPGLAPRSASLLPAGHRHRLPSTSTSGPRTDTPRNPQQTPCQAPAPVAVSHTCRDPADNWYKY